MGPWTGPISCQRGEHMKEALVAVHVEELPEGGFLATSEDLPGLVAQGRTVAETLEIAQGRGPQACRVISGTRGRAFSL